MRKYFKIDRSLSLYFFSLLQPHYHHCPSHIAIAHAAVTDAKFLFLSQIWDLEHRHDTTTAFPSSLSLLELRSTTLLWPSTTTGLLHRCQVTFSFWIKFYVFISYMLVFVFKKNQWWTNYYFYFCEWKNH